MVLFIAILRERGDTEWLAFARQVHLRAFGEDGSRKKAIGWLLSSVLLKGVGQQPGASGTFAVTAKQKGLEEETLVTSSNPVSQVMW
jgi:hypothetical protein